VEQFKFNPIQTPLQFNSRSEKKKVREQFNSIQFKRRKRSYFLGFKNSPHATSPIGLPVCIRILVPSSPNPRSLRLWSVYFVHDTGVPSRTEKLFGVVYATLLKTTFVHYGLAKSNHRPGSLFHRKSTFSCWNNFQVCSL